MTSSKFYIYFHVKDAGNCRKIGRVSVDNGHTFDVKNGDNYRLKAGKNYTLKIYQGTNRKSRKEVAWTINLSGKQETYYSIDLYPYMSDPRKTGAPNFSTGLTPAGSYGIDLEYASTHMPSRGEFNVFMKRKNAEIDSFNYYAKSYKPVPLSRWRINLLEALAIVSTIAAVGFGVVLYNSVFNFVAFCVSVNLAFLFFIANYFYKKRL